MNWSEVQTNWPEISNKAKSNWNKLDEDEVDSTLGNPALLSELIQKQYGCDPETAEQQLEEWLQNLLGTTQDQQVNDPALDEKLDANLDTPETIEERDTIIGSPYHKGY